MSTFTASFFRLKSTLTEEKQVLSILLGQKQPSAFLLPARANARVVHASQNLPHIQTCHRVKTATSDTGPWEAAQEGAGVKTSDSIAVSRHPSAVRLTGKLCSSSNENKSTNSSKGVLLLHNHLSTPVVISTLLPSFLSLLRGEKEKGAFLLLKASPTTSSGVKATLHLLTLSTWSLEMKQLLWVRYLQNILQASSCTAHILP